MTTNTLSTSISHGITLDAGTYLSPFTITGTGVVAPQPGTGGAGVYGSTSSGLTLINEGTIGGASGSVSGGDGVILLGASSFTNAAFGTVTGGAGGSGSGGAAIHLLGAATFTNSGTIGGGSGQYGGVGVSGSATSGLTLINSADGEIHGGAGTKDGGTGATLYGARSFSNSGAISGGTGSSRNGGAGVSLTGAGTFSNTGTIAGGGGFGGGEGLFLAGSGIFTNSGVISGASSSGLTDGGRGIDLSNQYAVTNGTAITIVTTTTIINDGTIEGGYGKASGGYGLEEFNAGSFDNRGIITGGGGGGGAVYLRGHGSNSGTLSGGYGTDIGGYGVRFVSGTLTNSGVIAGGNGGTAGGYGVFFQGGVLIDSGLIAGGTNAVYAQADAVAFSTYGAGGTLVVEAGASFVGSVIANATLSDVLAIGGTAAASIIGFGTEFLDFSTIAFESGSSGTVEGNFAAGPRPTITGFAQGDTLILDGFVAVSDTYVAGVGLELTGSKGGHATFDITGSFTTSAFTVSEAADSTTITVHCYARGTRIETPVGDIEIETLSIGDLVITASGAARPIIWIGTRRFDPRFVGRNPKILPIRICRDALADGVPRRDLLVSPEHAMLIDDVLVAAKHLVNGVSIRQEEPGAIIEYFHLELDTHDAVLAEGAAAETYIEDGDRGMFHNAAAYRLQRPAQPHRYCAERIEAGARLEAIRATLDARAGVRATVTEEPDIHLLADGRIILPCAGSNGALAFDLPHPVRDLVLVSRRTTGTGADCRHLGIAVAAIAIDGRPIDLARLSDRGWHDLEGDGGRQWRWTDGAGQLFSTKRHCRITIEVAGTLRYRRFALAA